MRTPANDPNPGPAQLSLFDAAPCAKPRLYTIHPSLPFLQTLARALLDGELPRPGGSPRGPLDLAAITLLLPTRRATRALQDAFLAAAPARALLLPRVKPIAEGDDELTLLAGLSQGPATGGGLLDLAPAIGELERRLVLTRLVLRWSASMRQTRTGDPDGDIARFAASGANTPAQAANLARELARLIDMVETENVALTGLKGLVTEAEFSRHWQQTLTFLDIVTAWWPEHLREAGKLAPMDRRNRTILAETARLTAHPPAGPMIVAGVTGSIPATVGLMRAIGSLPQGCIVLPGLDLDLDEAGWQAITGAGPGDRPHAEHPQFGLKSLLDRLGVTRADVVPLGRALGANRHHRMKLVSEAMRPSATTAGWHAFAASADRPGFAQSMSGVTLIEAPTAETEAETIALILREAAQTPGRTAALVSPDRLLARRVVIRLEAWGIRVDDSAGRPFGKTVPGTVLDLAIAAVAESFAPAPLVALLKHPLVRLGLDPFAIRRAARALELGAFRQPYLGRGLDGVLAALDTAERACAFGDELRGSRRPRPVRRLFPQDWQGARDLVQRLSQAAAPLIALFATQGPLPLHELTAAHAAVTQALCAEPAATSAPVETSTAQPVLSSLWQGEAGLTARTLFDALTLDDATAPAIAARDYPDLYRTLVATETVRPRVPVHPCLSIWGPLEARLQQPDIVILASLNDGTWPGAADPGPWLNRPMRAKLGLPSPEEEIGRAAHDFTQLLAGPRVFLTRAEKIDGVPSVPSRWLMRLKALLAALDLNGTLAPERGGPTYLAWARQRDAADAPIRIHRPRPCPPFALRPRKLSVSAIETWIANPYAIFASRILGLEPLPAIGSQPDAAIRGGIIHEALARFVTAHPEDLPADCEAALLTHARDVLKEWTGHARVAAFWLPRLERFAQWFGETEPARRAGARVKAEISGETVIGSAAHPFTLTARADRIDIAPSGIIISDYKTGAPPSAKKVLSQKAPQLLLEAAIALAGGFPGVPGGTISGLRYIRASGGDPAGEETFVATSYAATLAGVAIEGLNAHIARFDDADTPYAVARRARFQYDFDPFAHLARVAEWSAHTAEEG